MESWERQEGEPTIWHHRFEDYYLVIGPDRNLEKAWRAYKSHNPTKRGNKRRSDRATTSWRVTEKTWNWKQRAQEWDEHQRQERIAEFHKGLAEANERHRMLGRNLAITGGLRVQEVMKNVGELTPGDARLYITDGIKLERMAMGLPTEVIELLTESEEDLERRYAELVQAISDGSSGDESEGDASPESAETSEE